MQHNNMKPERKKRFAPAAAPMGGRRGPGPAGRFMEKPKLKDSKGTILRLLGYLKYVKWYLITALSALLFFFEYAERYLNVASETPEAENAE